jgi:hypothetical protein
MIRRWTRKGVGTLCLMRQVSYDRQGGLRVTAEDRLVQAVAKIQLSPALVEGWLDPKVLTEAHHLAW